MGMKLRRLEEKEHREKKAREFKEQMSEILNKDYLYQKYEKEFQKSQEKESLREQEIINEKKNRYSPKLDSKVSKANF